MRNYFLRIGATLSLAAVLCGTLPVSVTAADEIPPPLFVKIVLAAVAFDRNLDSKAASEIHIGFSGTSSYSASLHKTLKAAATKKLKGKSIVVHNVDAANLAGQDGLNIVVFGDPLGSQAGAAGGTCKSKGWTCVSTSVSDVENGLSLGVELNNGKPRLVINLPAATESGSDYSAQILRLARVVGQ